MRYPDSSDLLALRQVLAAGPGPRSRPRASLTRRGLLDSDGGLTATGKRLARGPAQFVHSCRRAQCSEPVVAATTQPTGEEICESCAAAELEWVRAKPVGGCVSPTEVPDRDRGLGSLHPGR